MTSSNPPCREGPNQFRPLTDASPGSARSPGRRVPRPLRRPPTTAYTLSFERKASPFFANVQSEFTNPLILSAAEIRAAIAVFRWGKLSSSPRGLARGPGPGCPRGRSASQSRAVRFRAAAGASASIRDAPGANGSAPGGTARDGGHRQDDRAPRGTPPKEHSDRRGVRVQESGALKPPLSDRTPSTAAFRRSPRRSPARIGMGIASSG